MNNIKRAVVMAIFLGALLTVQFSIPGPAHSADFEVYIAIYKNGEYIKPYDRKIVIRQRPLPFHVVIKNTTSSSQQLFGVRNRSGEIFREGTALDQDFVALEVKPETGSRIIVKKKSDPSSRSTVSPYRYIGSGKSEIMKILMDPDEWEGLSKFNRSGIHNFKVRAIYDNGGSKLYSPYYDVTLK